MDLKTPKTIKQNKYKKQTNEKDQLKYKTETQIDEFHRPANNKSTKI